MSITLGRFEFDGPYATAEALPDGAGVFAILCREEKDVYHLDIDESDSVRTAVFDRKSNTDQQSDWSVVIKLSSNFEERQALVRELQAEYGEDTSHQTAAA